MHRKDEIDSSVATTVTIIFNIDSSADNFPGCLIYELLKIKKNSDAFNLNVFVRPPVKPKDVRLTVNIQAVLIHVRNYTY